MTNEQLMIIIIMIKNNLIQQIEMVETKYPDLEHEVRKDLLGHTYKFYPSLSGFQEIADNLEGYIKALTHDEVSDRR